MAQPSPTPPDDNRRLYARSFAIATVAIFALLLYWIIQPMLRPLAWAAFLGFLMQPLQNRLTGLLRNSPTVAAGVLTVATLLLVVVPLTLLGAAFASQAVDLAHRLQSGASRLPVAGFAELSRWPPAAQALEWVAAHLYGGLAQLEAWAVAGTRLLLQRAAAGGGMLVLGAASTVLNFTIMLFLLFFFVRDGMDMGRTLARLVPLSDEHKATLLLRVTAVTRAVAFGTVLTAAVQGILLGIGFAISDLPAPVVFGVIGAVLSVVPFGGTAIVWVPGVLWLFSLGDIGHCLFLAAWGVLVVSTVDNFLKPFVISGQAQVPTLAVFIGVLGGLAAFGLIGMFVGPVIIAVALTLLEFAHQSLKSEGSDPG